MILLTYDETIQYNKFIESNIESLSNEKNILEDKIKNWELQKLNINKFHLFSENIFSLQYNFHAIDSISWSSKENITVDNNLSSNQVEKEKSSKLPIILELCGGYFTLSSLRKKGVEIEHVDSSTSGFGIFKNDILDKDEEEENNERFIKNLFEFQKSDLETCILKYDEDYKLLNNNKSIFDICNICDIVDPSDILFEIWDKERYINLVMNINWTIPHYLNHDINFLKKEGLTFICLASKNFDLKDEDFYNEVCIPNPEVYSHVYSEHVIEDSLETLFQKYSKPVWNNNSQELKKYNKNLLKRSPNFIGSNPLETFALFNFTIVNYKIHKNYLTNFCLHYFQKK